MRGRGVFLIANSTARYEDAHSREVFRLLKTLDAFPFFVPADDSQVSACSYHATRKCGPVVNEAEFVAKRVGAIEAALSPRLRLDWP